MPNTKSYMNAIDDGIRFSTFGHLSGIDYEFEDEIKQ